MPFQKVRTVAILGLDVLDVNVEVNIDNRGFPGFEIVGLGAREISESKERIKSAIRNSGFKFPSKKIVVNLAPADLPKKGSLYDVPIAIGILAAAGAIKINNEEYIFTGELSLNGDITKIFGSTLTGLKAASENKTLVLPYDNSNEVSFIKGARFIAVRKLNEIICYLQEGTHPTNNSISPVKPLKENFEVYLEDIKGQSMAKRAIKIAVAGRHNICLIGSPGSGKTLLAKAAESILPPLNNSEFIETARISSLSNQPISNIPPYRSPNHPISNKLLVGGVHPFSLGEITLAHKGILFIDEFAELDTKIINILRQPIESKQITISLTKHKVTLPCDFMLIAAANACACGNAGDIQKNCTCTPQQLNRYLSKLKSPLMDRIDMFVNVASVDSSELLDIGDSKTSVQIRAEVAEAKRIQTGRCYRNKLDFKYNANLSPREIEKVCVIEDAGIKTLKSLSKNISSRGVHKVIKISQTISDLESSEVIKNKHILEALQYKSILS